MNIVKIALLLLFYILDIAVASGANYYISNHGSDSNPGTIEQPWAGLRAIKNKIKYGDAIYLQRGSSWKGHLSISTSNITIDAYGTGQPPIIDASSSLFAISSKGVSGLTIQNLKLINARKDCLRITTKNRTTHNITIVDNIVSNCGKNGVSILTFNNDIDAGNLPYDIHILKNNISDCGNSAIFIRAQGDKGSNIIARNVIDNVGTKQATNAISLHFVHKIIVEYNKITNTHSTDIDGSGITADFLSQHYIGSGSIIRHNEVTCPTPPANETQAGIAIWFQPNVKVYSNTINNCNEGIRVSGKSSLNYTIENNTVHIIKFGLSFTNGAPKGIANSNTINGTLPNSVGIYVSKGSLCPSITNNITQGTEKIIMDLNTR